MRISAWFPSFPSLIALLVPALPLVSGQSAINRAGEPCNINATRLAPDSNQLQSSCGYLAWCDPATSRCRENGCRRDEYPFGYNNVNPKKWPPLCAHGQFCPDELSHCMDRVPIGGKCQLSRDDQCVQSPDRTTESECLHNVCEIANASEGSSCISENIIYTNYVSLSDTYGDIISRDTCRSGLYCDVPTLKCMQRLHEGMACSADKECISLNCLDANYTSQTPVNNDKVGICGSIVYSVEQGPEAYVYVLVTLAILMVGLGLCICLTRLHQKQRAKKNVEMKDYWEEQRNLRAKLQVVKEELARFALNSGCASPDMSLGYMDGSYRVGRSTSAQSGKGYWMNASSGSTPNSPLLQRKSEELRRSPSGFDEAPMESANAYESVSKAKRKSWRPKQGEEDPFRYTDDTGGYGEGIPSRSPSAQVNRDVNNDDVIVPCEGVQKAVYIDAPSSAQQRIHSDEDRPVEAGTSALKSFQPRSCNPRPRPSAYDISMSDRGWV